MGEACSAQGRNEYHILVEKHERKDHSEDLGVDGSIILVWILGKQGMKLRTGFIWLRIGNPGGLL